MTTDPSLPNETTVRELHWVETDETGAIYGAGMCQPEVAHRYVSLVAGRHYVWFVFDPGVGLNFKSYYVDGSDIFPREALPVEINKTEITADDVDEAVLSGIPEGATVFLDEEEIEDFTGSTLELSSPMPAIYSVRIEHWPYLPFEAEIVAQ